MKVFAYFLAALAIVTVAAPAQVPVAVGPRNIKIQKIVTAEVPTPLFQYLGTQKRFETSKWFEIEVEFAVDGVELVDELTMEYLVSVNGKLCPGEVTLVNIPKGQARYSVMYISPRNMDRLTGGKPFNPGMVDNVWIILSKQGQRLAEKAVVPKAIPNLPRINDMLSPKSETPFYPLWWDRYEAVRGRTR